ENNGRDSVYNSINSRNDSEYKANNVERSSSSNTGFKYSSSPKSTNSFPQHHTTFPYGANNVSTSSTNDNETVNRSSTLTSNVAKNPVSSPTSSYANDITPNRDTGSIYTESAFQDSEITRSVSFASHSVMTSNSNFQDDDDNEDTADDNDIDGIVGKYVCMKEFKAKEDFQIDLQLNDTVTVNQFTGKYILGKNCSSGAEGLFPIYYIDSLDGNYVFFRCKEEMEFTSVNDQIFLLREADNDFYPGYNITKGEQGIFSLSKLEPIIMDDSERDKYGHLYNEEINRTDTSFSQPNKTMSTITLPSSINESDIDDSNAIADPILPANTTTPASNDIMFQLPKEFTNVANGINGNGNGNQVDQGIVEKLLEYYKTIPELQDDTFNKAKSATDNNLYLMRDAIKKFQEFREDKDGIMMKDSKGKMDSFFSPSMFEDLEVRNRKWEANRYRCQELVETEKSYCDKMKIMIDKFMKPLEAVVDTENEMLNRVQISLIFKNIPDIYEFSYKLHQELAEAFNRYDEEGPIPIATVFLNKFSDWKIYIKYVEDFHSANTAIENLKRSPQTDRFNRFMEQCQKSEECNKSHLKDLIVLPIQRFLKYRLLFEGIKKDSDPRKTESYNLLDTVENYIFEIGEIMNNAKKIQENINKMFSLEKTIMNYPPELISYTQRTFIGEWNISEILKNKHKRIYLYSDTVLFASILNRKKNRKYKYAYENRIDILDYTVTKSSGTASTKIIKFIEVEKSKSSRYSQRSRNSHSHSLLGFYLNNHTDTTSITKSLFFFETEEACNDFVKKYNEQREELLKEANKK
ncbi:hypothetical protein PIROE2DRAFT_5973, partial [Piromyces sp. E2]